MPSLRQLLASHRTALLIDAASSRIQVAWLEHGGATRWATSDDEAGVGIFQCVESLGAALADAGVFLFCDGPGSILGVRTSAMALRTWNVVGRRPVFAYSSLNLVAHALGRPELGIIADARRDSWHHTRIGEPLRRIPAAELTGQLVMPEYFRHWSPLPAGVRMVPYSLSDLLQRIEDADLFHETDAPDAFLHEEPTYVKWIPQIHRAPAST